MSAFQDKLKVALHELIETLKEPYQAIKEAVEKLIPIINNTMEKIKQSAMNLKESVENVVTNMKEAFAWLEDIVEVCNESKGSPFKKCSKTLMQTRDRCQ